MKCSSAIFILTLLFASQSFGQNKAKKSFDFAQQLQKSSRFEEAIAEYQNIEQNFPYSKYAKLAQLKVADVYFEMRNYIQAQYQYKYYHELHPKDENSDYALFRSGLSLYKQLPKSVDRDLSKASEVLKVWRETLVKHPGTKYTKKILDMQQKLIKKLGKKELYIANFYYKQDKCISAQSRINKLFTQYPTFMSDPKALKIAIYCSKSLEDGPAEKKYKELLKKSQTGPQNS